MSGAKLMAFDAKTGQPVESFGDKGGVDVGVSYGGTPTISGDVAVIGAATLENPTGVPGNPRAFDVRTGKKLWEFQTVPKKGQLGADTWLADNTGRSGTNMWAFSAPVDEATGTVYIPIGTSSPNYWGGSRPGANLFGNSIVALDMKTGKYKWHFQTIHHDLWDSDMPSTGPLVDLTVAGKKQKGIVSVNKTSLFFELSRTDGKPLFKVEERPVPQGDVPGEWYSPTQPFPTQTPALSRNLDDEGRHRHGRRHDGRARRGLPGDVGQGRRFPQRRAVHAFLFPQGRRSAEVHHSVAPAGPAA